MGSTLARATRRLSLAHIRYLTPVHPRTATGLVAQVYRQVEADFGMLAPPVALHAAAPEVLAAVWTVLRETLLVAGRVSREEKEAVAAAVSLANSCPYCVEVHGAALAGLVRGPDATAIATDRIGTVADPQLRALAQWARASGIHPSGPRPPVPFAREQAAELIGVAVTFHYINRMVNVFLQDSPLPPVPDVALSTVRRGAARLMGGLARTTPPAGESLALLADAPLPADLSWAVESPHIAAALARGSTAIDAAGARVVPAAVRERVLALLADRAGTLPGLNARIWLDGAAAGLAAEDQPAARLALLTAFGSFQVTGDHIAAFRDGPDHDEEALVELASWASLTAARQIGNELARDCERIASGS